jgi:hypothetical protein
MFTVLLIVIAASMLTGRVALNRWFNPFSIGAAICGSLLILFESGLFRDRPVAGISWFYIFSGWSCLYLGGLIVLLLLVRGHAPQKPERRRSWEQGYLCRWSNLTPEGGLPSRTSWELFLLFGLQSVLLGASDELDIGKLIFAAIYVLTLLLWSQRIVTYGFAGYEPLVRWTVALMGLGIFSRLWGMYLGVSTVDWVRDFLPLLHFSWILVGAFAFISRRNIWQAYLVFVGVAILLTFAVTDNYLVVRQLNVEGWGLIKYVRSSDAVVLFGVFMTAPMTVPGVSPYRAWFILLAGGFVSAALLTGTRSHVIAILAGLVFYFWLTAKEERGVVRSRRLAVVGSMVLGVVAFGLTLSTGLIDSQMVIARAEQVGSADYQGLAYRYQEAVGAWDGFRRSPVFGQGLGYAIPQVFMDTGPIDSDLFMVHDFYMYVPLKFGIIGIAVFLGVLVSMVRTAISTFRQAQEPFDRAFAAGLASLLVALLVESITSSRFTDRTSTAMLAILFACLLSIRREIALSRVLLAPVPALGASLGASHGGISFSPCP